MDNCQFRLKEILNDNGFFERVEALSRMDVVNAMAPDGTIRHWNKYLNNFTGHSDGVALLALIGDYLAQLHLDLTLDVFLAETGTSAKVEIAESRAIMRLVNQLPVQDDMDTPLDALVQFYREELLDNYPGMLERLKRRLNLPDYQENVQAVGADTQIIRQSMRDSLAFRQTRDENEVARARSMECRDKPVWYGREEEDEVTIRQFANVLQSTGDQLEQTFWEREMSDEEEEEDQDLIPISATFDGSPVNNGTFIGSPVNNGTYDGRAGVCEGTYDQLRSSSLDRFRLLPGGQLDIMAIAEDQPENEALLLSNNRLEDLKEALSIDDRMEVKVNALGPNFVVKQMEPEYKEEEDRVITPPEVSAHFMDYEMEWDRDFRDIHATPEYHESFDKTREDELQSTRAEAEESPDQAPNSPPKACYRNRPVVAVPVIKQRPATYAPWFVLTDDEDSIRTPAQRARGFWNNRPDYSQSPRAVVTPTRSFATPTTTEAQAAATPKRKRAAVVKPPKGSTSAAVPKSIRPGVTPRRLVNQSVKTIRRKSTSQPQLRSSSSKKKADSSQGNRTQNRSTNTVQKNYRAPPSVITPVIQASLEEALNAKYDSSISTVESRTTCGKVNADIVASYSVPVEGGSSEQTVQDVLRGKASRPPRKIKLVLKTADGKEEPINIPVVGQQKEERKERKKRATDSNRLQVPELDLEEGNLKVDLRIPVEIEEDQGQRYVRPLGVRQKTDSAKERRKSTAMSNRSVRDSKEKRERQRTHTGSTTRRDGSSKDKRSEGQSDTGSKERKIKKTAAPPAPKTRDSRELRREEKPTSTRVSSRDRQNRSKAQPKVVEIEPEEEQIERFCGPEDCYGKPLEPIQENRELLFPGQKRTVRARQTATEPKTRQTTAASCDSRESGSRLRQAAKVASESQRRTIQSTTAALSSGKSLRVSSRTYQRTNSGLVASEVGPRPKIRHESRRPLVTPVETPKMKRVASGPLVEPSRRAEAERARSAESMRVRQRMSSAPKVAPRQVSDLRKKGGCTSAQAKLPDDFRLGQRVIPVEMPNARSSKRIVLEDVRMAMEAPPMIAPRPVTEDRLRFGCSTAQAAPVNDFRSGSRVMQMELPKTGPRKSREQVKRSMEARPSVAPRDVSASRRLGGTSLAEGKQYQGWRSGRVEPPPALGSPPARMSKQEVRDLMEGPPSVEPRECSAPRKVFACSTAKPFKREDRKWR